MQRFYGGDPLQWEQMPMGWVRAYAHMYPRLRDEETLREIAVVMAGSGTMAEPDRLEMIAGLRRETQPTVRPPKANRADLEFMSIRVVEEN